MGTAAKPTRENRTITVDFQNETTYFQLLGDGKASSVAIFIQDDLWSFFLPL